MGRKLRLLFNTIRYLKPIQILHQLKYRLLPVPSLSYYISDRCQKKANKLSFVRECISKDVIISKRGFDFLNLRKVFLSQFEWDFNGFGRLWNYNLQYFECLSQKGISVKFQEELLVDFYEWQKYRPKYLEPYPVSVRSINIVRFLSKHEDVETRGVIEKYLYGELKFLIKRLEFHLLGNHLLENAFALMMCGAYFNNDGWLNRGDSILQKELNEQILADGAHFELSPMYHKIIFFRLLELVDWYSKWYSKKESFERYIRSKASDMRAWLENISFRNGDIPHFNDSANDLAHPTAWLLAYADQLYIPSSNVMLGASGYRSIRKDVYECKIDIAQLGPDYQPGHSHADTLSFVLYCRNNPVLVDTGTSTYEAGERRGIERNTASHNTVTIGNRNQSEVYGIFRVGHRSKTTIIEDGPTRFAAFQNGYLKSVGLKHERVFDFYENGIKITDTLNGNSLSVGTAHFHFHPTINVSTKDNHVMIEGVGNMWFFNAKLISKQQYFFASGFNKVLPAVVIRVTFESELTSSIRFD